MNKAKILFGILISGMATSGLALAECPRTMPNQLFEDCIVYEGAGASFPPSDYAYIDLYREWKNAQNSQQVFAQTTTGKGK